MVRKEARRFGGTYCLHLHLQCGSCASRLLLLVSCLNFTVRRRGEATGPSATSAARHDHLNCWLRVPVFQFGEMPYHLVRARRFEDLYKHVLFNYEWLHAKLSSCPLQGVLSDFEDACNNIEDREAIRSVWRCCTPCSWDEIALCGVADGYRRFGETLGIRLKVSNGCMFIRNLGATCHTTQKPHNTNPRCC